jgi:CO dehydrogenase maturation factor
MTVTIAVAGKGGTGKTTLSGLLVRYLVENRLGKVLAIDADPSSNLHLVLGLPPAQTVGDIREDARGGVQPGMSRQEWLDYSVRMAVEEGNDFDMIAMGRPEGQGCYCAANHMLRNVMDAINSGYDYVVMDNEAGMEHLSRRCQPARTGCRRDYGRAHGGAGDQCAQQLSGGESCDRVAAGRPAGED